SPDAPAAFGGRPGRFSGCGAVWPANAVTSRVDFFGSQGPDDADLARAAGAGGRGAGGDRPLGRRGAGGGGGRVVTPARSSPAPHTLSGVGPGLQEWHHGLYREALSDSRRGRLGFARLSPSSARPTAPIRQPPPPTTHITPSQNGSRPPFRGPAGPPPN